MLGFILVQPSDLRAVSILPQGLGVTSSAVLQINLRDAQGAVIEEQKFQLARSGSAIDPSSGQNRVNFALNRGDRRKFQLLQARLLAMLGQPTRVQLGVIMTYCADGQAPSAAQPPVAQLINYDTGDVLLHSTAPSPAAAIAASAPRC